MNKMKTKLLLASAICLKLMMKLVKKFRFKLIKNSEKRFTNKFHKSFKQSEVDNLTR